MNSLSENLFIWKASKTAKMLQL